MQIMNFDNYCHLYMQLRRANELKYIIDYTYFTVQWRVYTQCMTDILW